MSIAEQPVSQEVLNNFEMPQIQVGSAVCWYQFGVRDANPPQIGFVLRCSPRGIILKTSSGDVRESVRHIDDPKLTLNSDQRENGAWDYTDEFYENKRVIQDLQDRLSEVESRLTRLTTDKIRRTGNGLTDYHKLRKQALAAGIKFVKNPKTEWLKAELKKLGINGN